VATTLEKIEMLISEVRQMDPRDADESTRGLIEMTQIMGGLGFDLFSLLMPQTDAEADQQVDALLAVLFQVRGDDLPPFDLERHVLEETAMDE
jgi:hypothetical protein